MKKLFPLLLCTLSLTGISQAQTDSKTPLEKTSFEGLKFRSIGPALTSGRIADLAVNPKNHNEYYVATASGGVWKTTNHGITFLPFLMVKEPIPLAALPWIQVMKISFGWVLVKTTISAV